MNFSDKPINGTWNSHVYQSFIIYFLRSIILHIYIYILQGVFVSLKISIYHLFSYLFTHAYKTLSNEAMNFKERKESIWKDLEEDNRKGK